MLRPNDLYIDLKYYINFGVTHAVEPSLEVYTITVFTPHSWKYKLSDANNYYQWTFTVLFPRKQLRRVNKVQIDFSIDNSILIICKLCWHIHLGIDVFKTYHPFYYYFLQLTIIRQRDKLEPWFNHFMAEDKGANGSSSYVDFLCHIHKEIRNLLN